MKLNQTIEDKPDIIELLFNSMPFSYVYWKNVDGIYMGASTNQINLFDPDKKGFVGKTIFDILDDPISAKIIHDTDTHIMQTGIPEVIEEVIITPQGEKKIFLSQKQPIKDNNQKIIGLIGFSLDITERKIIEDELKAAKEAAEAATQAKTKFIANMSHDIRTPLTGVIGLSEILENTLQNPEQKENAHLLRDSGEELLNMLNDILDDVRAEHMNEDDIQEQVFDLYRCIDDLVRLERPTTKLKKLDLNIAIDGKVPQYIISDRKKIHRILLNLIGNAIKFTQSGSITIEVKCLNLDPPQVHLQFAVADTGIGISKELQPKVFDRFFRISSSYKGLYKGHGLGLHIAQSYVSLLGGHITLISEERQGSTFYFDVRCKLDKVKETIPPKLMKNMLASKKKYPGLVELSNKPSLASNSAHLLLVEDNPIALKVLESIATQAGFQFTSASTGEDALALAKTTSFQLAITDIGLPGISGNDFTRLLREWENTHHKIPLPVLGLTGHAREAAKADCQASGMNEVFTKPVNIDQLNDMVKRFALSISLPEQFEENFDANYSQESNLEDYLPSTEDGLFKLEQFPLFDLEEGIQAIGNSKTLKELMAQMIKEFANDINDIQTAYQNKNWENVERIAHKLKSSAYYCGTLRMKMACQYLEHYQKAGHSRLQHKLYEQLLNVLEETRITVLDWLNSPT